MFFAKLRKCIQSFCVERYVAKALKQKKRHVFSVEEAMTEQTVFKGIVKFYKPYSGYGFINCQDIPGDLFFHWKHSLLPNTTYDKEDIVFFELGKDEKGRTMAVNIRKEE